jgi:hypothetical protein
MWVLMVLRSFSRPALSAQKHKNTKTHRRGHVFGVFGGGIDGASLILAPYPQRTKTQKHINTRIRVRVYVFL